MGEHLAAAEDSRHPGPAPWQERPASPGPAPAPAPPTPSRRPRPGAPGDAPWGSAQVGSAQVGAAQVSAVTVLALLDQLAGMLDAVRRGQRDLGRRQAGLEGSVGRVRGDLGDLCARQAATDGAVAGLLRQARGLSAQAQAVRERVERRGAQVARLQHQHARLLARRRFRVLVFQEENEIPAGVFVKEPASRPAEGEEELAEDNQSLEETLHTVDLSSGDDSPHDEEALQDSSEEAMEESRAEKMKRSGLQKVDSLKKAFSRQNIEKKMNKLGTKIVSVERREKIKKSLASNHQKISSGKRSPFKVSPLTFVRKKVREGESPAENESRWEATRSSDQVAGEQEQSSLAKGLSQTSLASAPAEGKSEGGEAGRPASRGANAGLEGDADLTAREDEEEESVALEQAQKVRYEGGYLLASEGAERSDEEPEQPAVLQVDQSA
ncbi:caveolae-associated protein 2 isoform X1 [Canis lupus familiaris]|nr:caveolae-associated protein 2 isoform X1 [Canis lupus familiaris]XP_038319790.1 caveolae-associated protein 2 isoform X1 [Canis lupus familiaris]